MPVEINELIIRARVNEPQPAAGTQPETGADSSKKDGALKSVRRAVEEVMDIVKRKNER